MKREKIVVTKSSSPLVIEVDTRGETRLALIATFVIPAVPPVT